MTPLDALKWFIVATQIVSSEDWFEKYGCWSDYSQSREFDECFRDVVWINEFSYENVGTPYVELAGIAGTPLLNFTLQIYAQDIECTLPNSDYNPSDTPPNNNCGYPSDCGCDCSPCGGANPVWVQETITFTESDIIPDQQSGYGTVSRNLSVAIETSDTESTGTAVALAYVAGIGSNDWRLQQTVAFGGPADAQEGYALFAVAQNGGDSNGGLRGTGYLRDDFSWSMLNVATPGGINDGQQFDPPTPAPSADPTTDPTTNPSTNPSANPSTEPTSEPSSTPPSFPSSEPTFFPTSDLLTSDIAETPETDASDGLQTMLIGAAVAVTVLLY